MKNVLKHLITKETCNGIFNLIIKAFCRIKSQKSNVKYMDLFGSTNAIVRAGKLLYTVCRDWEEMMKALNIKFWGIVDLNN